MGSAQAGSNLFKEPKKDKKEAKKEQKPTMSYINMIKDCREKRNLINTIIRGNVDSTLAKEQGELRTKFATLLKDFTKKQIDFELARMAEKADEIKTDPEKSKLANVIEEYKTKITNCQKQLDEIKPEKLSIGDGYFVDDMITYRDIDCPANNWYGDDKKKVCEQFGTECDAIIKKLEALDKKNEVIKLKKKIADLEKDAK